MAISDWMDYARQFVQWIKCKGPSVKWNNDLAEKSVALDWVLIYVNINTVH